MIKRLPAIEAFIESFAGRAAEDTHQFGMGAAATGAGNYRVLQCGFIQAFTYGWCNTKKPQLFFCTICHPIGGPCRRQHLPDGEIPDTMLQQCQTDLRADEIGGRAARIGWGNQYLPLLFCFIPLYTTKNPQIGNREHRNLRIHYRLKDRSDLVV